MTRYEANQNNQGHLTLMGGLWGAGPEDDAAQVFFDAQVEVTAPPGPPPSVLLTDPQEVLLNPHQSPRGPSLGWSRGLCSRGSQGARGAVSRGVHAQRAVSRGSRGPRGPVSRGPAGL
ncbi:unnamed protein product [Boreogadus saida]